ncbi:MAG: histidine kinase dimerization/phospho-acceptor domain-containing protein, partial [Thermoanaerobaculia bacterium]
MKGSRSAVAVLIALVVLTIALVVLGTLQYRWIGQMADAERQRMRAGIEFAAHHYSDDFDHELTRIFVSFQMPLPEASSEHLLRRYDEWAASTRDLRIVRAIYFVPPDGTDGLQLIDPATHSVRPVAWPASFAPLRPMIEGVSSGRKIAIQPIVPGLSVLIVPSGGIKREMIERHMAEMAIPRMAMPPMNIPLPPPSFTIVDLDRDYIARVILPDLTHRYFDTPDGRDYEVAVVEPENGNVVYRSDVSQKAGVRPFRADFNLPIFSVRMLRREPGDGPPPPMAPPAGHGALWHLLVRYHSGSLEQIVGATRRRNLLLTGGILAVLAGTVVALAAMLRDAERLRLQQLEFVAGVTHELNTPVAALTSAGQNLADGIITEPSQVARYGAAIVKESRRLTEMIGQVLAYGGMQSRRKLAHIPVDMESVIDEAIGTCRWMAEEQSVVI